MVLNMILHFVSHKFLLFYYYFCFLENGYISSHLWLFEVLISRVLDCLLLGEHARVCSQRVQQCDRGAVKGQRAQVHRRGAGVLPTVVGHRGFRFTKEAGQATGTSFLPKMHLTLLQSKVKQIFINTDYMHFVQKLNI